MLQKQKQTTVNETSSISNYKIYDMCVSELETSESHGNCIQVYKPVLKEHD